MAEDKEIENVEKEITSVEKLESLIKHVHNDVENMRRDVVMLMHKVDGIAFLHEVTRRDVEEAINSFDVNLDELYSPIDAKDREGWLKHLDGEKTEKEKFEEL